MSVKWKTLTSTVNVNHSLFETSAILNFGAKLQPQNGSPGHITLHEKLNMVEVHPALGPTTPIWGYDGKYPGPCIEVDSGKEVRLKVVNAIAGKMPYAHVVVDEGSGGSMNDPGADATSTDSLDQHEAQNVAALTAWTVVHLHGAPTHPDSDGWTDNVIGAGEHVEMLYKCDRESYTMEHPPKTPNGNPVAESYQGGAAPMYWYHDHGMSVTRFNVFAGLAGGWLVRDPVEQTIGLPTGEFELPLILQDRNFETADGTAAGDLTGRFLHKVQIGVRECFAPANIVNGKLWPRAQVKKHVYRLRIVNGANARVYRLHFMGMKTADETSREILPGGRVQQIGTDGGLLGKAVDLPLGSLILSPGERADVLVDFGLIAQDGYQHVVVYNSAAAPFNGAPLENDADIYTGNPADFREFPQVMLFDLQGNQVQPGIKGQPIEYMTLDPAFKRLPIDHTQYPADHGHNLIALREEDVAETDPETEQVKVKTMLFLHEMMDEEAANKMGMNMYNVFVPDPADPAKKLIRAGIKLKLADDPVTYVTVAKRFNDMTSIFIEKGSWQLWKIINLSPDTHPFHIHLVQFQAIKRKRYLTTTSGIIDNTGFEFTFVDAPVDAAIDANETGWKDTVRVNPGDRDGNDQIISAEMVTVAAQFNKRAGRYMYHCHILEHEDSEMMRSFVVVPKETMPFMSHLHHHHAKK